jgi:hypothetical protein
MLGEVVTGRVVGEVVPWLVPPGSAPGELAAGLLLPGELVPLGDGAPDLVGVPLGELPPPLPGTEPRDEVVEGLDVWAGLGAPLGELVLGPELGEPWPGLPSLFGTELEGDEPGEPPVLAVPLPGL